MKQIAIAMAVLASLANVYAQKAVPVAVYVFTAPAVAGFVDQDSQRRADTVKDLRKALAKRKALVNVESADAATVALEVTSSSHEKTGEASATTRRGPFGELSSRVSHDEAATVRVMLRVGQSAYETELVQVGDFRDNWRGGGDWTDAANGIARQVEHWVKDNAAQLAKGAE